MRYFARDKKYIEDILEYNQKRRWRRLNRMVGYSTNECRGASEAFRWSYKLYKWSGPNWKYSALDPQNILDIHVKYSTKT